MLLQFLQKSTSVEYANSGHFTNCHRNLSIVFIREQLIRPRLELYRFFSLWQCKAYKWRTLKRPTDTAARKSPKPWASAAAFASNSSTSK